MSNRLRYMVSFYLWRRQRICAPSLVNCHFSGYFARVRAYQILVEEFLALTNQKCQIINLGAGFDTLYWLLHEKSTLPKLFMEVDFGNITAKKCRYIRYVNKKNSPQTGCTFAPYLGVLKYVSYASLLLA